MAWPLDSLELIEDRGSGKIWSRQVKVGGPKPSSSGNLGRGLGEDRAHREGEKVSGWVGRGQASSDGEGLVEKV